MVDFEQLDAAVNGEVNTDDESRQEASQDFGKVVRRQPAAIVRPESEADVQKVIQQANRQGFSISTRGAGHSQSGQSLSEGGVVLDLTSLAGMEEVDHQSVWVRAGTPWNEVVKHTMRVGQIPRVLTNNLNVTVGGTLSMAGLGVASHRFGTQADNVLALDVVTGEGDLVTCSPEENSELFDCVRCGLGQFGVIVRAHLQLRECLPNTRTFCLLYDDIEALLQDQTRILAEQKIDFVESRASPNVQGLRRVGEARLPFAEWFYPMHLTLEFHNQGPSETDVLKGLHYYRLVHQEDLQIMEFVFRLEPVFAMWKEAGTWGYAHPWMETILPWNRAGEYILGVLQNFPPNLLVGGHVLMWPCRGMTSRAPLFIHPEGDLVMGFGILPAVPERHLPMVLPLLNRASDLSMQIGGKRYLSGWVEFDATRWQSHFGDKWQRVMEWKRFYDPRGILNPGFITYPEADTPLDSRM